MLRVEAAVNIGLRHQSQVTFCELHLQIQNWIDHGTWYKLVRDLSPKRSSDIP